MSSKGGQKHLKTLAAPRSWNIPRKEKVFVTKPDPGSHGLESIPLTIIVRDLLKYADNQKEASQIIKTGQVLVDGKKTTNPKTGIGFMDVLTVQKTDQFFRMLYDDKKRLSLIPITKEASLFKLCRIKTKTTLKKAKTQYGFHDGRTLVSDKEYKLDGVIKLAIPKQEVLDYFALEAGNTASVTGGKHTDITGQIKEVRPGTASVEAAVVIESQNQEFIVPKKYVFVIGKNKPEPGTVWKQGQKNDSK